MSTKQPRKIDALGIALRVLLVLAVALAALLVVLRFDEIRAYGFIETFFPNRYADSATVTKAATLEFSADTKNVFHAVNGGLMVLSPSGLEVVDDTDTVVVNVAKAFSRPAIASANGYTIAYETGGRNMIYLKGTAVMRETPVDNLVIHAAVNSKGRYVIVSEQAGSKAAATVYNEKHEPLFKWFSSERYISFSTIAPAGDRIALAGIKQHSARIVSSVSLFSVSSEEPLAVWETLDELVLGLEFLSDDRILVLCETEAVILNGKTGAEVSSCRYGDYSLAEYAVGDGFFALRLFSSGVGDAGRIEAYDFNGEYSASISVSGVISMSAFDNYLGVLTSDSLLVYNKTLEKQASGASIGGARFLILRSAREALILTSSMAQVFEF